MGDQLVLDGRQGEGGGQILRSSLALAAALGRPIRIDHIRAGRRKPGLMRQHLACVRAAAAITAADLTGAELGSTALAFVPGPVRAGDYRFSVGSAGSALLVLQTVLVPLLFADGPSTLVLEGGTHNPMAPPFEALALGFVPQLERMGARLELSLVRPGFVPAGGGEVHVTIHPVGDTPTFELVERGALVDRYVEIHTAHLAANVACREAETLRDRLRWDREPRVQSHPESAGPGNAVHAVLVYENVTEVLTGFGEKSLSAKLVATRLSRAVRRYLTRDAPVGEHLADQLMLPLALLGGGRYRCTSLSSHTRTQVDVINAFCGEGTVRSAEEEDGDVIVTVRASRLVERMRP